MHCCEAIACLRAFLNVGPVRAGLPGAAAQMKLLQARERPEPRRQRRQPGAAAQIMLLQARVRPELRRQRRQPGAAAPPHTVKGRASNARPLSICVCVY